MSQYPPTSTSHPSKARPAAPPSSSGTTTSNNSRPSAKGPPADPSSTSASHHQRHHHEDRLAKTWRSLASSVVVAGQKADKAAADPNKKSLKDLDDVVVGFLRTRVEWGRLISYLEAKLEGKAKEMETLQQYVKTQPSLGRKRKREPDVAQSPAPDPDNASKPPA